MPIIFIALVIGLGISFFGYTLTIEPASAGLIKIKTLSLGEYHTPVAKLSIYNDLDTKVLEFSAKNENSRMHTITLREGVNSFDDMY